MQKNKYALPENINNDGIHPFFILLRYLFGTHTALDALCFY